MAVSVTLKATTHQCRDTAAQSQSTNNILVTNRRTALITAMSFGHGTITVRSGKVRYLSEVFRENSSEHIRI